jgi:hypothetical protein
MKKKAKEKKTASVGLSNGDELDARLWGETAMAFFPFGSNGGFDWFGGQLINLIY